MKISASKSCSVCDGYAFYGGIDDKVMKMPDNYCPTCKENICDIEIIYEHDGCIVIEEETHVDACDKCGCVRCYSIASADASRWLVLLCKPCDDLELLFKIPESILYDSTIIIEGEW